ncbi:MAG: 23S rRNA (adenine(2503)-C(2))-methyltransferase RlmN, partial [Planctomycetota bacterium]|nr:23S rRNA (adenine(2503)-C(2))-methyltransferase RlmN [Planctomycetota bacterium]
MTHILDPDKSINEWLAERLFPAYRAKQIRRWLYQGRAESFEDMSDLPKALRDQMNKDFTIWTTKVIRHQTSKDG